jgi:cytochrome c oxidase subunit 1
MQRKSGYILATGLVGFLLVGGVRKIYDLFTTGLNPLIGIVLYFLLFLLVIGVFVVVRNRWRSDASLRFAPEDWFWAAFTGWLFGSLYCRLTGSLSTLDFMVHDTYFVIANADVCMGAAILFGLFGLIYRFYPRLIRKPLGRVLGLIHFWVSLVASTIIIWPTWPGVDMPRRYISYADYNRFEVYGTYETVILWLMIAGLAAQLVFLVNLVYSATGRRKSVD